MRFFRTVLIYLATFVVGGWLLNGTVPGQGLAHTIAERVPGIAKTTTGTSSSNITPQSPTTASTPIKVNPQDSQATNYYNGNQQMAYRWPTNSVTIALAPGLPEWVQKDYLEAIKSWNAGHVVNLQVVDVKDNPDVLCQTENLSSQTVHQGSMTESTLGETQTSINVDTQKLAHADVNVDPGQIKNEPHQHQVWVAEHEIGHALGLQHTPESSHTVMEPVNLTTGITGKDIANLRTLYQ